MIDYHYDDSHSQKDRKVNPHSNSENSLFQSFPFVGITIKY